MGAAGDAATGRELMSAADVGRTISRIAHQIIEKTALDGAEAPRVVLLGIPTRGVTLAKRLAANIGEYSGMEVGHGPFNLRYWSTAATANCRCARTMSARTCRPHAARACTCY